METGSHIGTISYCYIVFCIISCRRLRLSLRYKHNYTTVRHFYHKHWAVSVFFQMYKLAVYPCACRTTWRYLMWDFIVHIATDQTPCVFYCYPLIFGNGIDFLVYKYCTHLLVVVCFWQAFWSGNNPCFSQKVEGIWIRWLRDIRYGIKFRRVGMWLVGIGWKYYAFSLGPWAICCSLAYVRLFSFFSLGDLQWATRAKLNIQCLLDIENQLVWLIIFISRTHMEMKMLQWISTQDLPVFACRSLHQVQLGEILPNFHPSNVWAPF